MNSPRITCLTGAGQTGANAYLVEVGDWSMLLDAGASNSSWATWLSQLDVTPDVVWISHVHADHIGALAALRKRSPSLDIVMTPRSSALMPAALRHHDQRRGHSTGDVLATLASPLECHRTRQIHVDASTSVRLTPYPCGHMFGAASLYLEIVCAEKFHRILYLPDFSAHALPMTPRAAFPLHDPEAPIDLLIMEGMLGADRDCDALDFDDNLALLVDRIVTDPKPGGQLLALAALGESCEIAWALVHEHRLSGPLVVHDYLQPIFEACEQALPDVTWAEMGVMYASQSECEALLGTGHVVIAPGEHLDDGTPARYLSMRVRNDPAARIVLLNGVRRKSMAGRLCASAARGETSGAEVMHVLLPSHAPRWALKGVVKALKPRHTWLIHGQKSSLMALAKALRVQQRGRRWASEVIIPDTGDVFQFP